MFPDAEVASLHWMEQAVSDPPCVAMRWREERASNFKKNIRSLSL
jgi:hypothetical protein